MLRDYQQRAIDMLYQWLSENNGNPCLELPTGSGKSHIVAALCKDIIQSWPETTILMLTHVKELIEQNAQKMREHWANAPMGIYSAGMGKRQLGEPITFAGIQSVRNKSEHLGHIDLIIVDECHLVSHKDEGSYRSLIAELTAINPALRVIGLTATPYRLGHGYITDKPAIFDDIISPVSIEELIHKKYLSALRSKVTGAKLDVSGVHKRGGEYIESELQEAVNNSALNAAVVDEVLARAQDRKSWLFFCAGVNHARDICAALKARGIVAECVTGETPKKEREKILKDFKDKKITALTNANVLTTGFDAPDTDLIALLRPTLSASLYVQMVGRGMRLKQHTDHCLVLDFAGCISEHGPVTYVRPPTKKGEAQGEAPVKACPECSEILHLSVMLCPACGFVFEKEPPKLALRDDDIMGLADYDMSVTSWTWRKHTSRASGKYMLKVTYYGALSDEPVSEYLVVAHDGVAGQRAIRSLLEIAHQAGAKIPGGVGDIFFDNAAGALNSSRPPDSISYKKDGKFFRVIGRKWGVKDVEQA